jgi:hypothetical protein
MIADRDVWQAAVLIVKRYGDDAMLEGCAARLHFDSMNSGAGVSSRRGWLRRLMG